MQFEPWFIGKANDESIYPPKCGHKFCEIVTFVRLTILN